MSERFVLLAWIGGPTSDHVRTLLAEVDAATDQGVGWSMLYTLASLLPHHPSLPRLLPMLTAAARVHREGRGASPMLAVVEAGKVSGLLSSDLFTQDTCFLGWGEFYLKDAPSSVRYPWGQTCTALEFATAAGVSVDSMGVKPDTMLRLASSGKVSHGDGASLGPAHEETLYSDVYGRMTWEGWEEGERVRLARATGPWPTGTTPFEQAAIAALRTIGGRFSGDIVASWILDTPIGELRYTVSDGAVHSRFDDASEAARQLGGLVNPFSGKWNHYAFPEKGCTSTEDDAARIVNRMHEVLSRLTPVTRGEVERRGWVRG